MKKLILTLTVAVIANLVMLVNPAFSQSIIQQGQKVKELEERVKLLHNHKSRLSTMQELDVFLESESASVEEKNRAANRLVELQLYFNEGLSKAEEMLGYIRGHSGDPHVLADTEYLYGLLYMIKKDTDTRSVQMQRANYIRQGVGSVEEDPFQVLAIEHFNRSVHYTGTNGAEKSQQALNALHDPLGADAFLFFNYLAEIFDETGRYDTVAAFHNYLKVVNTFENGVVSELLFTGALDAETTVNVITWLSKAYFKIGRANQALEINQSGADYLGKSELSVNLRRNRAYLFNYLGRMAQAEFEYKTILQEYPIPFEAKNELILKLGSILEHQKKFSEAKQWYQEIKQTNPVGAMKAAAEARLQVIDALENGGNE
jgi:tetratricopeptide (TPR) repeat protein